MAKKKDSPKSLIDPQVRSENRSTIEEQFLVPRAEQVGRNLRALRVQCDLSSDKLAEICGISPSLIRSIESGRRSLLIGNALVIVAKTGVDISSLLFGKTLLEWGGAAPFTADSYREWVQREQNPSAKQERNCNRQLQNLCDYACNHLGAGHLGNALLSAHLHVLMGGVDHEIQYAGVEK